MDRLQKRTFVEDFSSACAQHECVIVVRQVGLSASLVEQLRRNARAEGVVFRVIKNSLAKRSLQESAPGVAREINGPVGVFFSQDPVAAAKLADEFSKKREDKFFPIVGLLSGKILTRGDIKTLASLPNLLQLRGQLLSVLNAPASRIASIIKEPLRQLACVLQAYSEKH